MRIAGRYAAAIGFLIAVITPNRVIADFVELQDIPTQSGSAADTVNAQNNLDQPQNVDELERLIVVSIRFPPYVIVDDSRGDVQGAAADKTRAIAAACGARVEFLISPAWTRAFRLAADGTVDAVIPMIRTQERQKDLLFSRLPIIQSKVAFLVPINSPYTHFSGLDMLKGKRIMRLAEGRTTAAFDLYSETNASEVLYRHSYRSLAENLIGNRTDFAVGDADVLLHHLGLVGGLFKARMLEPALAVVPQFIALSKQRAKVFPEKAALYQCISMYQE